MTKFSFSQLEGLWIQNGGNPVYAPIAAAVALAESRGDSNAINDNSNGTQDRGLWQINSGHGSQSTFDIVANVRAAIAISNNGTNWRPWCTAYSDGLCGSRGGTFMGPGTPALKQLALNNGQLPSSITMGSTNQSTDGSGQTTGSGPQIAQTAFVSHSGILVPQYGVSKDAATGNAIVDPSSLNTSEPASWWTNLEPKYWWQDLLGATLPGQANQPGVSQAGGVLLGDVSKGVADAIASGLSNVLAPIGRAFLHGLFVVGGVAIMALGVYWLSKEAISVQRVDTPVDTTAPESELNETNAEKQILGPPNQGEGGVKSNTRSSRAGKMATAAKEVPEVVAA